MIEIDVSNYPLQWPAGWPRTAANQRQRAAFGKVRTEQRSIAGANPYTVKNTMRLEVGDGLRRLQTELNRLGARNVVISSNLRLRIDGWPVAGQSKVIPDPGIAVYFAYKGKALVLACDKWDSAADNMAAIAGHIEAIRAQARYGVGNVEQALAGYKALPADSAMNWRAVFGFKPDQRPSIEEVESAFKQLAREKHPDRGGTEAGFAHISRARDFAREELTAR